ncbi:lysosomal alpha-mannosidase-like [Haemaphysalis longicornis]
MTLGLRFLNDTFGPKCGAPSVAWQADPFGHTSTQAALFSRMGFSSLFLGRISFDLQEQWQNTRSMEFVWEADSRRMGGDDGSILAWVPENRYEGPKDIAGNWAPYTTWDNENVNPWDVLAMYARNQTKVYTSDTVAVLSGGDFAFENAVERFRNQDRTILLANAPNASDGYQTPIHVFHSTPACYIEALHKAHRGWPRFSGELLPYTDTPGRTWSGYYSSRPNLKMMVRHANGFLQP